MRRGTYMTRQSLQLRCSDYYEPPSGWFPFGHHADSDTKVVFSTETCECGNPLWERPAKRGEKGNKAKQVEYVFRTIRKDRQ